MVCGGGHAYPPAHGYSIKSAVIMKNSVILENEVVDKFIFLYKIYNELFLAVVSFGCFYFARFKQATNIYLTLVIFSCTKLPSISETSPFCHWWF